MGHAGCDCRSVYPRKPTVLIDRLLPHMEGTVAIPTGDCPRFRRGTTTAADGGASPLGGAYLPDEVDMGTGVSFDRFDLTETERIGRSSTGALLAE